MAFLENKDKIKSIHSKIFFGRWHGFNYRKNLTEKLIWLLFHSWIVAGWKVSNFGPSTSWHNSGSKWGFWGSRYWIQLSFQVYQNLTLSSLIWTSFPSICREVLWHSLMEILVLAIPLLNLPKLKNTIVSWTNKSTQSKVDPNLCVSCHSHLVVASKANCAHHFCYYCLAANLASNPQYPCPVCQTVLKTEHIQPIRINRNEHLLL